MKKSTMTLAGVVQKLIDRSLLKEKPHVHLAFADADYLYDSLRIPIPTVGKKAGLSR